MDSFYRSYNTEKERETYIRMAEAHGYELVQEYKELHLLYFRKKNKANELNKTEYKLL